MGIGTRLHLWRGRRYARRRVRAIADRTSAVWITEDGLALEPPTTAPRGVCHICHRGKFTERDRYSGVRCCDHCGAPRDQVPGAMPRDGVACSPEHLAGECGCRSVGRPDLDARERERVYL